VNQRVETPAATEPNAASAHLALVLSIASRGSATFSTVSDIATMSPDDQADAFGSLLDDLDTLRACVVTAREGSYRLAELESLLDTNGELSR
jgi:hypothetical protein